MGIDRRVRFIHQAAIYGSDRGFVAMAAPFLTDGLAAGEPVLAVTTPANLELIGRALSTRAECIGHAENAYFGRRPVERVNAFRRYWTRCVAAGHQRVRILAEPLWAGRTPEQVSAWTRMESCLNLVLADTGIVMICPYDARVVDHGIVTAALRTHPECVAGGQSEPSTQFSEPGDFARDYDSAPLPLPPADAATLRTDGDPDALGHFAVEAAADQELPGDRIAMLTLAVAEACLYLAEQDPVSVTMRIWTEFQATVCDLYAVGARVTDPALGLCRAADGDAGNGIWLARQVCDRLEVRSDWNGTTLRLYLPGPHAEEVNQAMAPLLR